MKHILEHEDMKDSNAKMRDPPPVLEMLRYWHSRKNFPYGGYHIKTKSGQSSTTSLLRRVTPRRQSQSQPVLRAKLISYRHGNPQIEMMRRTRKSTRS